MNRDNNIKISFKLTKQPAYASACVDGQTVFACGAEENMLNCMVYYDFRDKPLTLKAAVHEGDFIEIVMMSYRIELRVNQKVCDEEWPAGCCLFRPDVALNTNLEIQAEVYTPIVQPQPYVVGTFTDAEGWKPSDNIFVGDCMPYVHNGRYHVLYLRDRRHHGSKWGLGAHQWEHISTTDFRHWEIHPTAIGITAPNEGSICTGSWIKAQEIQYLFYAVRMIDGSPAHICRCISHDGYHFEKDHTFSFMLPKEYDAPSTRDPKVVADSDGLYHMFLTTSMPENGRKGCLAHFVSFDLYDWKDAGSPIYVAPNSEQPECPDYFYYRGYYYLVYSLNATGYYLYSDSPFSGWKIPQNPVIPCGCVPKGAIWEDKIVFTGFKMTENKWGGTMTFVEAVSDERGELIWLE